MGKRPKRTPEEHAERLKREREFRELLERRLEVDRKLAAEHGEPPAAERGRSNTDARGARLEREREFRELLERRVEVDRRLAAEREQRSK
jgi:hypothetical protein